MTNDAADPWAELIDLYRRRQLTKSELSNALELDRFETELVLKHSGAFEGSVTLEDLAGDRRTIDGVLARFKSTRIH